MEPKFQELILKIADASQIIVNYFGQILSLETKTSVADFRTKADVETEAKVIAAIEELFPDYNIHGEESGTIDNNSDYTFYIDPLDGTNNFSLNLPVFSTSVGLVKGNTVVFGLVHNPFLKASYYAFPGQGAFLNGARINVNQESNIHNTTIEYNCGYNTPVLRVSSVRNKLADLNIKRQLSLWSPAYALCLLASGKIEALINEDNDIYDYVAGKLIVQEAGGNVTRQDGNQETDMKNDKFVASNGSAIHSDLVSMLISA